MANDAPDTHEYAVTLSAEGQITLPQAVCDALGLRAGDGFRLRKTPDGLFVILSAALPAARLHGRFHVPGLKVTLEEMDEAIAAGAAGK